MDPIGPSMDRYYMRACLAQIGVGIRIVTEMVRIYIERHPDGATVWFEDEWEAGGWWWYGKRILWAGRNPLGHAYYTETDLWWWEPQFVQWAEWGDWKRQRRGG